jgi:transcriptional regulator with XRE-family HTH domain
MKPATFWFLPMYFPARLIQLRKALDLIQQGLAEAAQLHVNQIRCYEAGTAQPTLKVLIRLATLHVRLDNLEGERGPGNDNDMTIFFEVVREFSEEKQTVRAVLAGPFLNDQYARKSLIFHSFQNTSTHNTNSLTH